MFDFINYIFESGISLGLFTLFYLLLLQKETFFRSNRYFLLFVLFFSLFLPLVHLRIYDPQPVMLGEITVLPYRNLLETVSVYGTSVSESVVRSISASTYLLAVYLLGVIFFSTRLLVWIFRIAQIIRKHDVIKENGMKLVVLDKDTAPFSFMSYIFAGRDLKKKQGWEKMLVHEYEHVRQGHSFDILTLEIISVFQWFNPFFWLLKRGLKENHEYLADRAVLKNEMTPSAYKQLLLSQFIGPEFLMTSSFNSLIKKRISMMSKISSSKLSSVKLLTGILVAVTLIIVFACEKKTSVQTEPEQVKNKQVALVLNSDTLQLSGDQSALATLRGMLSKNPDVEVDSLAGGGLRVKTKLNDVNGVSVIAYDKKSETEKNDSVVFFIVEDMPEFPGGELALRKYISNSIRYPAEAQEKGIQGKVYVNFVVGSDGSVSHVKIARGKDPSLDREAIRVVSSLPKWKPGIQKGKKVAVSYTVPINFLLQ